MEYRTVVTEEITKLTPVLKDLRDWVYEHPETALKEYETSEYLCKFLEGYGFEVERKAAGIDTAFVAKKRNGNGRKVALMAEYDALPEVGHACGHHLIATSTVGAALGLAAALDAGLEGEVIVVGSPAEETGEGKPILAKAGYYDGCAAAASAHPSKEMLLKPKWIAIGGIDFTFTGVPAHAGSAPFKGVNALDAMFIFYSAFSALRQQLKDETRIHGIVMEGGSAANIIPDHSRIRLEFRSPDNDYYNEVEEKVIRCAKGAALAAGCELEYRNYEPTCCGVTHNDPLAAEYGARMAEYGHLPDEQDFVGSTDAGDVSIVVPTIHPTYRVTDEDYSLHTKEFREETMTEKAFDATVDNTKALAETLLKVLEDDGFAEEVMDAFLKKTN